MEFVAAVATQARVHDQDVLLVTDAEGIEGLERVATSALVPNAAVPPAPGARDAAHVCLEPIDELDPSAIRSATSAG